MVNKRFLAVKNVKQSVVSVKANVFHSFFLDSVYNKISFNCFSAFLVVVQVKLFLKILRLYLNFDGLD